MCITQGVREALQAGEGTLGSLGGLGTQLESCRGRLQGAKEASATAAAAERAVRRMVGALGSEGAPVGATPPAPVGSVKVLDRAAAFEQRAAGVAWGSVALQRAEGAASRAQGEYKAAKAALQEAQGMYDTQHKVCGNLNPKTLILCTVGQFRGSVQTQLNLTLHPKLTRLHPTPYTVRGQEAEAFG